MSALLTIDKLAVGFRAAAGWKAVRELSLTLNQGDIIGLVGESGSGKSLSALALMGLLPRGAEILSGRLMFRGQDLRTLSPARRRELRGRHLGLVFQEPLTALNPVLTIGDQVAEIFRKRQGLGRAAARAKAVELLAKVGLSNPGEAYGSYPHRFSGGMRQRVVLAMALALSPELLIADEPTTALDPTIAAQILALLRRLAAENNSAVLFITHNLRLLAGLSHRVLVMYAGLILEEGPSAAIFSAPAHPYTKGLLAALPPGLREPPPDRLPAIPGRPPAPGDDLPGCPFAPRCPDRFERCPEQVPEFTSLGGGRRVRCFLWSRTCCG